MCDLYHDEVYGYESEECDQARELSITIHSMREVAEHLVDSLYNDEELDEEIVINVMEDFCRVLDIHAPREIRLHERTRQFAHGMKCVKVLESMGMRSAI